MIERLAPQDVEEIAFQVITLYTNRIQLVLCIHPIFLYGRVQYLLLWIGHGPVDVHDFIDHVLRYYRSVREVLDNDILDATDGLAAYTYIYLSDLMLENGLEPLDDIGQALSRLVQVVDDSLAYACAGVLLDDGINRDTSVDVVLSGNAGHLG